MGTGELIFLAAIGAVALILTTEPPGLLTAP
jgi:hypothetical protein